MELLLIRHALPHRVELEVGAADPGLSEKGRAPAGHLAGYLANEHLDALYSSPLRRAWQTAEAISPAGASRSSRPPASPSGT